MRDAAVDVDLIPDRFFTRIWKITIYWAVWFWLPWKSIFEKYCVHSFWNWIILCSTTSFSLFAYKPSKWLSEESKQKQSCTQGSGKKDTYKDSCFIYPLHISKWFIRNASEPCFIHYTQKLNFCHICHIRLSRMLFKLSSHHTFGIYQSIWLTYLLWCMYKNYFQDTFPDMLFFFDLKSSILEKCIGGL